MITSPAAAASVMVRTNPQAVACDLGGEAVILHLETGIYFGLNSVASDVWNYIQSERSLEEIIQHLLVEYKVDRARCEAEVLALLEKMTAQGLVTVQSL